MCVCVCVCVCAGHGQVEKCVCSVCLCVSACAGGEVSVCVYVCVYVCVSHGWVEKCVHMCVCGGRGRAVGRWRSECVQCVCVSGPWAGEVSVCRVCACGAVGG